MPQLYHFVAEQFKESLMLGGQSQHMVAGRLCQYLKPWQLEGLRFLYKNHEKGESCILNDESCLGKVVTVATFLGSILTNDTTKKCLIVVRDDEAIERWRFHLSVLTHLTVKVIEKTTDINFETVFLIKWSTLKSMSEIDKVNFDHIIIDNRGEMLNNKFCTGILLNHFENKTTIIISSVDVTSDIKLLHILLRLCGRLERQYIDLKAFEDKFQLPQLHEGVSNKVDLEDYFLKRERVINFCREFRLRRYCHQFEEEFPIVSRNEFQRHLEQWRNKYKNSLSSGSVKLLSSSSEKDTEELFKEYFQVKQERDIYRLDNEVRKINEEPCVMDCEDTANNSDDVVVMSPLLFDSESESDNDETQMQNELNSQFIEDIEETEMEENVRGDKVKKISNDLENDSSLNEKRKSPTPVKTPTSKNNNNDTKNVDDSKNSRSRTILSPKKSLAIRKKSYETKKLWIDGTPKLITGDVNGKRLRNRKDKQKTKVDKKITTEIERQIQEKPKTSASETTVSCGKTDKVKNKDKTKPSLESKNSSSTTKSTSPRQEKRPEKSSKTKDTETEKEKEKEKEKEEKKSLVQLPINESPTRTLKAQVKLKSIHGRKHDKHEKTNNTTSKEDTSITEKPKQKEKNASKRPESEVQTAAGHKIASPAKDKTKQKTDGKENKKDENASKSGPSKVLSTIVLMLEEAQKFVSNENIGRKTKEQLENTKRRYKAPKVPEISTTKERLEKISSKSNETTEETNNTTPKKTNKKLTELMPLGVHGISTRGMERQTRSNRKTSKYMKVAVEQVETDKKTITKKLRGRRKKVSTPTKASKDNDKPPSPTPSVISESPTESLQLGQALTPTNCSAVPDFVAPAPKNFHYHFPLMLDKETSDSECQITSQGSYNNEIIVLSGSSTNEGNRETELERESQRETQMEPPKSTVSRRKVTAKLPMVTIHRPIFDKAKSPDLFSTCSDLSLPCSQQQTNKSHFEGFKIFGSELRQSAKPRSCLDILERMLEPRSGIVAGKKNTPTTIEISKSSSHQPHCIEDEDAMFEITSNGTFGNAVRINSNGDISPIRNKNNQSTPPASGNPKNRITNYLITNSQHASLQAQPSPSSLDDISELLPKTPKRRKSISGNMKRSPRSLSAIVTGHKSQSTKLTQWLVKNSNSHIKAEPSSGNKQSSKRRRLDLSFPDK